MGEEEKGERNRKGDGEKRRMGERKIVNMINHPGKWSI